KTKNENGFTLVELMIVLVVIVIMSAIAVPQMDKVFTKNKLRASTTSVTSSLYLARMKSINDGEQYGVQFNFNDGTYIILKDPYGTAENFSQPYQLEDEISFNDITFVNDLAVFNEYGQLDKNCLPSDEWTGIIEIVNTEVDTTMVEVTFISGRIRETNR
ncbi:Tfp pilus assembly protein FimT/FimU, partial [Candidatus Latescibacterota bacterium]